MASEQTPEQESERKEPAPEAAAEVVSTPATPVARAKGQPAGVPAHPEGVLAGPVAELEAEIAAEVAEAEAAAPAKMSFIDGIKANPRRAATWGIGILVVIIGFVWPPVPSPHVALGGEPISIHGPWWLTNSVLHTLIVDVILLVVALAVGLRMKMVPTGLQNFMEMVLEYFYRLAEQIAGKAARNYFPWIMTIFLFVIVANWSGITPGVGSIGMEITGSHAEAAPQEASRYAGQLAMADGNLILISGAEVQARAEGGAHFVPTLRAPTADLNVTFALAITTMFMVQFWGFKALGFSYLKKFFNASGKGFMKGINIFVGLLELVSEFARILSFGFRLFGNIFAGEIVLATMAFLAAFLIPLPFYLLEVFVGFVQALVFTMLALVFFSMATVGHHDDSHAEAHH